MNCDNQCCENHGHEHCHDHHELSGDWYGINVTALAHCYGQPLTLEDATELVPKEMRKPGTRITFWTYSGWETWQFFSKDVREWVLPENWKQEAPYGMDNIKDLQNQIDSIQIGGWAISQEFGEDEHIGISQKKLTEEFAKTATLDSNGKVPPYQLPSYVDDVVDGYLYNSAFYADASHTELLEAVTGRIYVDIPSKVSYRYSGSTYIAISNPYMPDEEDLTVTNDAIKFKDKAYNAAAYSGLGRKYLRKNLVNGVNVLAQSMLDASNTEYIIQYDYDLNNAEITVPANCVLKFEGGSLTNGTIISNMTKVVGDSDLSQVDHYGAFFDENGVLYGYSGEKGDNFNSAVKTVIDVTSSPSYNRAFQSADNYNDYYVVATSVPGASSTDGGIVVFDKDFSVVKRGKFAVPSHNNTMCIKDGYCYVAASSTLIYRFSMINFLDSEDEEENIISIDQSYDMTGKAVGSICYDKKNNRFVSLALSGIKYFDTDFNLIGQYNIDVSQFMTDKLGKPGGSFVMADANCFNGLGYLTGRLLSSTESDTYYNFIVAFDLTQNAVADAYKLIGFPWLEFEGLVQDIDKSNELIAISNTGTYARTALSLSFSKPVNTGLQFRAPNNNILNFNKLQNTFLYVNNAYEGISDGSSGHPFKSIKEALAAAPIGGMTYIRIVSNEGMPYQEGTVLMHGSSNVFFEGSAANNKTKVEIDLRMFSSTAEIKYIDFVGASKIQPRLSRLLVRQSAVDIDANANFILTQSSDIYLENVSANSGNALVELDTTYTTPSSLRINNLTVGCTSLLSGDGKTECFIYPITYRHNYKGITFGENSYAFQKGGAYLSMYTIPLDVYFSSGSDFADEVSYLYQHLNADNTDASNNMNKFELHVMASMSISSNPIPVGVYEIARQTGGKLAKMESYNGSMLRLSDGNATLLDWLNKHVGQLFLNSVSNDFGFIDSNLDPRRYDGSLVSHKRVGTSSERPLTEYSGFQYFDTTLGKPIWWAGNRWVDSEGETQADPA